jgi:two-component system, OmpR family, response regulator
VKIFLVEDNAIIRENLVATIAELTGATVVGFAETEADAIDWFLANVGSCDLAIIDIRLRHGSGVNVLRALQQMPRPHTIVVLTNYAFEGIRQTCLSLGADRVFDKSNELDALFDFVAAA